MPLRREGRRERQQETPELSFLQQWLHGRGELRHKFARRGRLLRKRAVQLEVELKPVGRLLGPTRHLRRGRRAVVSVVQFHPLEVRRVNPQPLRRRQPFRVKNSDILRIHPAPASNSNSHPTSTAFAAPSCVLSTEEPVPEATRTPVSLVTTDYTKAHGSMHSGEFKLRRICNVD